MPSEIQPKILNSSIAVHQGHHIMFITGFSNRCKHMKYKHNTLWRYNIYTNQWRKYVMPKQKTTPDHDSIASAYGVTIGEDVYVLEASDYTNDLWKLSHSAHECWIWEKVVVKSGTKKPSPRQYYNSWEYSGNLWIFGVFGPPAYHYLNDHGEHTGNSNGKFGFNNQLLRFNPVSKEWTNPKSYGAVPAPEHWCSTTAIGHKVWLGQDFYDELYELNMNSLVWTHIQFSPLNQQERCTIGVNGLTDTQLAVCSNTNVLESIVSETWILDLPSLSWRQYRSDKACPPEICTIVPWRNNNTVIIGGLSFDDDDDDGDDNNAAFDEYDGGCDDYDYDVAYHHYHSVLHPEIFYVMLEVKCLQHLAMQTVFEHRAVLNLEFLPRKLITLMEISEDETTKK